MDDEPVDWHYAIDGRKHGPVSEDELAALARSGELAPDDLVWHEGITEWRSASQVEGLFPRDASVPPPLPSRGRAFNNYARGNRYLHKFFGHAEPQPPRTSIAGILSVLFGSLAIACAAMACCTWGLSLVVAGPLAILGLIAGYFSRGELRGAGIALNIMALIPVVILFAVFRK